MQTSLISNSRILIVDDDRGISSMAKRFLEQACKCIVREENFSERAVATAKEFKPDMVLLDWNMPILNGGDVAALLAAEPDLREVPILFITGYGDRARKMGHPILEKPFGWPALVACIDHALHPSAAAA